MYADDNGSGMPSLSRYRDSALRGLSNPPPDWCGSETPQVHCPVRPENGSVYRYVRNREVYLCPSDKNIPATKIDGKPKNYAISYDVNSQLHFARMDAAVTGKSSKVLLLIQEGRDMINDGNFAWGSGVDWPTKIHYDGSTASYCDGHAKWVSFVELERQRIAGNWKISK